MKSDRLIQELAVAVRDALAARLADGRPVGELASLVARLEDEQARRQRVDEELGRDVERVLDSGATPTVPKVLDRPHPVGVDSRASRPQSLIAITAEQASRGVVIAYRSANFTVFRAVVERLHGGELFRMVTQHGTFEIPGGDEFESAFPKIAQSMSYREGAPSMPGSCRYVVGPPPKDAARFLVNS